MDEFMDGLGRIVRQAVESNLDDPPAAGATAFKKAKRLPGFAEHVEALARREIQDMVYAERHRRKCDAKRRLGTAAPGPRVVVGSSAVVGKVYEETSRRIYDETLAGRRLGNILGGEYMAIAETESGLEDGHRFNKEWALLLSRIVPADATTESVPEKKILDAKLRAYRSVYGDYPEAEAA